MTISLQPKELGDVAVHLRRDADGSTTVTVTASRSETLRDLSRNVAHLHAALDAADVPVLNRVLTFSAPTIEQPAHATHSPGSASQNADAPSGQTNFAFGERREQRESRGQTSPQETALRQTARFGEGVASTLTPSGTSFGTKPYLTRINITA